MQDHKYPKTISNLMDVIESLLLRVWSFNKEKARSVAESVIIEIAKYHGGKMVYIPIGNALKVALKHRQIFMDWKADMPVDDISSKHEISIQTVYKVIKQQRKLNREKALPDEQSPCDETKR